MSDKPFNEQLIFPTMDLDQAAIDLVSKIKALKGRDIIYVTIDRNWSKTRKTIWSVTVLWGMNLSRAESESGDLALNEILNRLVDKITPELNVNDILGCQYE